MSREKALIKNTVILSLGTYLPKLTTIITLPLLTGHLTQTEYGTYDLIITLVSLLLPALTLQIQSAAFRFLITCRDSEQKIKEIVSNIFAFTIPISVVGLAITYFCLGNLQIMTKNLVIAYFFSDIIYIACGQVSRGLGKNFIYASGSVMISVANMIGICISTLIYEAGLNGILCSMLVSNLLGNVLLISRVHVLNYIDVKAISFGKMKELLNYSWPMVPNALSNWVLSLSNRLVILGFLGVEANAVYAVANKIPNLVKTFQGTFTSAWQENASISVDDTDSEKYYSNMFDNVNRIVIGLVAGLIAFTPLLFKILIRGEYSAAYQQMSLLFIGVYFSCMSGFLGGIYIAHMKTKSVGITTMGASVCNLIIDLIAIPYIGLFAASMSTLISYALLFVFRLIDIQKFQQLKINCKMMVVFVCTIALMGIVSIQQNTILDCFNFVFGICFALFVNRNLVKNITLLIRKKIIRRN